MDNVSYAHVIVENLVSVSKLAKITIFFVVNDKSTQQTILKGVLKDCLYHMEEGVVKPTIGVSSTTSKSKEVVNI